MITSITLQNFKSFGEKQSVRLEPITVLVGPNNSGKSCFLGVGPFVRRSMTAEKRPLFKRGDRVVSSTTAIEAEGGEQFLFHRPPAGDGRLLLGWEAGERGSYEVILAANVNGIAQVSERLAHKGLIVQPAPNDNGGQFLRPVNHGSSAEPFWGLRIAATRGQIADEDFEAAHSIYGPFMDCHLVKLSLDSLRQDAEVVPEPKLGADGSGLAAVLGLWRGSDPARSEELDSFLQRCLPEVKRALVKPAPQKSFQRLWIEQADGEQFDAPHLSDGVLFFTALAMHAIDAAPGALIFVEEPELSVHPRRLGDLMELFRRLASERKCQFVIATHSPVLLNELRDEPEAIVLFRRGEQGTRVRRLSDLPDLVEALNKSNPGDMLANGFFNDPF